jgi:hypothetical protein
MKYWTLSLVVAALSISSVPVFADNATATTPTVQPKPLYQEAKAECLKENASLKGKALKKCIHKKEHGTKRS